MSESQESFHYALIFTGILIFKIFSFMALVTSHRSVLHFGEWHVSITLLLTTVQQFTSQC